MDEFCHMTVAEVFRKVGLGVWEYSAHCSVPLIAIYSQEPYHYNRGKVFDFLPVAITHSYK